MKIERVDQLYTLCGDFTMPTGAVERTADGYRYVGEGMEVVTVLCRHKSEVTSRRDTVKNISDHPITLRAALSKFEFFGGEYEVYTQYSEWCNESLGGWQPLVTEVFAANDDLRMNAGANPFVALRSLQNGRGVAFHILADSTWQLRVRRHFYQGRPRVRNVTVELGIRERGFNVTLLPGETLELPEILYYDFSSRVDMDAYKLHRYCNDVYPARSLPIVYNSWMSRADVISYDILSEQLEVAREIGAEYFVIDAGWFGPPKEWSDRVGDWQECTDCSMEGRMKEFADKVRGYGLKFGLWFEVERASRASRSVAEHPEYYLDEGKYCFIDFANQEASDYLFDVVSGNIERYGIEFIKFDFNAPITYDAHDRSFLDYFEGYRKWIDRLRRKHPTLYMENCASGGLRMALCNLRGFDSFWMSDNHSLYTQLQIFKNTLLRMPSRALERWITIQTLDHVKGRSRELILVSGDARWHYIESVTPDFLRTATVGGPIGISCDVTAFSDTLKAALRENLAQYKQERAFWMRSECRILADTQTLVAMQFSDEAADRVQVCVYIHDSHQDGVTLYPVVTEGATYLDGEGREYTAEELARDGIEFLFEKDSMHNGYSAVLTKKK